MGQNATLYPVSTVLMYQPTQLKRSLHDGSVSECSTALQTSSFPPSLLSSENPLVPFPSGDHYTVSFDALSRPVGRPSGPPSSLPRITRVGERGPRDG